MSAPPNPRSHFKGDLLFLLPCLAVALLIRLLFFNGLSLHDDVNYWLQAIATGWGHSWPPLKTHWHTRIGLILPCALLLKIFGLKVWVPYLFTLLGSLLEIALTFYVARHFVSEAAARLATWLCVFFPLNVLYSSYLYPDLWVGLLAALSLLFWYRALQSDDAREYALASLFFGLGWLFRETVIMCAPIYLALWLHVGRWRRPKVWWMLPPALLILSAELLLYHFTAGNWRYRFDAMLHQQANSSNLELIASARGGFWLAPLLQLFTSHETGLFLLAGLAVAVARCRRLPAPMVWWLLIGFIWLSWGTTIPSRWVTLQRDPRYLSVLTIPCLTLLAVWVVQRRSSLWRGVVIAALIASGLLGVTLDIGHAKLSACRRFVFSRYNQPGTTLEPFAYFGARAAQNFLSENTHFACASDWGRNTTVKLIPHLPGTRLARCSKARYLVTTAQIQPEKWKAKLKEGWRKKDEFPGDVIFLRELVRLVIAKIQGHPPSISATPGLVVLENPSFTTLTSGTRQCH